MRRHRAQRAGMACALGAALMPALAGCGGGTATPANASASVAANVGVLPRGDLQTLVPQPAEVPTGLILVTAESGPADADKLATFAGSGSAAATAKAALLSHGFSSAYIAEYASKGGRSLTTVVTRFTSTDGAHADLQSDATGQTAVSGIGEEALQQTAALPGNTTGGQLVTERFRVGNLTFLVAVGGPHGVDASSVQAIAKQLAGRAR